MCQVFPSTQAEQNLGHFNPPTTKYATTSQRKALATIGRRGGKKAAKRWETDPKGEYAQNELKKLQSTNKRRRLRGQSTRVCVLNVAMDTVAQTGKLPSGREIAEELGVTKRTVNLHLKALREAGLLEID